jgi:hypothetical protein
MREAAVHAHVLSLSQVSVHANIEPRANSQTGIKHSARSKKYAIPSAISSPSLKVITLLAQSVLGVGGGRSGDPY